MSRLQIELSSEQHQRLKATAALKGQTLKQYVLERVLPPEEDEALKEFEAFIKPRIEAAERGELSCRTPQQIFEDVQQKLK